MFLYYYTAALAVIYTLSLPSFFPFPLLVFFMCSCVLVYLGMIDIVINWWKLVTVIVVFFFIGRAAPVISTLYVNDAIPIFYVVL